MRGASKVPEASVNGIFIALWTLAYLDLAAPEARPIKQIFDGMDSVLRFVLDHPLDQLKPFGMTTSSFCAILCATVFGKGEDSRDKGGFEFSQDLVNEVVMTHGSWLSGPLVGFFPTLPAHFLCALVNLCISDLNKPMLVKCPDLIATLVSGLIVDPEHQRKDMAEPLRAGIQRNSVECFLQLALFGEGRELLKRHTEALDALRVLSDGGALMEETSVAASSALAAVEGRLPRPGPLPDDDEKHIMMSCTPAPLFSCLPVYPDFADYPPVHPDQWNVQATIQRLVASLQQRGYVVWFGANESVIFVSSNRFILSSARLCVSDLECMKGSGQ